MESESEIEAAAAAVPSAELSGHEHGPVDAMIAPDWHLTDERTIGIGQSVETASRHQAPGPPTPAATTATGVAAGMALVRGCPQ